MAGRASTTRKEGRRKRYGTVLGALIVMLAGCGSSSSATTTPANSSVSSAALTASQVVNELKAHGLPVGSVVVYNATTDPNHLLGRPNGYTSKAAWVDSRIRPPQATKVDLGGSVEVYPTTNGAENRAKYIAGIAAKATVFNEYDYVSGGEVLRLSATLTPSQAQSYAHVIGATLVTASG